MATSKKIYVGQKAKTFDTSPRQQGYDMVVMLLDDNNYVSSPSATVTDKTSWESRENGEYTFTYNQSRDRWQTPNSTYANEAALKSNYGITLHYGAATGAKDGDVISVRKTTVNDAMTVEAVMSRSGNTLEFECPLVRPEQRQAIADKVLQSVAGYEYQPYNASGVHLEPATEIGDAITAFGILGGIYDKNTQYGRLAFSDIAATWFEESEEETGYRSETERKFSRRFAETAAELNILSDRIEAIVSDEDYRAELDVLAREISAKVSSQDGNRNSFGWSITEDGFVLYANGSQVFKCDRSGITVTGNGTFTGEVYASNIRSDATNGYGGYFNGGGITGGTIDTVQCSDGVVQSLGYADLFNMSTATTSPLDYFRARQIVAGTSFYSPKFIVADTSGGTNEYNLNGHYHSFTVVGDKIVCGAPNNATSIDQRSFNIADTQAYRDGVAAVTVASRAVLYCNATNYTDYDTGFDCDMSGSSYHYDSNGVSYGRIEIRNSSGTALKKIRVKLPAGGGSSTISSVTVKRKGENDDEFVQIGTDEYIAVVPVSVQAFGPNSTTTPIWDGETTVEVTDIIDKYFKSVDIKQVDALTTTSSTYTTYNKAVGLGLSSLYGSSSVYYGRIQVTLENGNTEVIRISTPRVNSVVRGTYSASERYSSTLDYYKWTNNTGFVRAVAKSSNHEILSADIDVTSLVNEAINIGRQEGSARTVSRAYYERDEYGSVIPGYISVRFSDGTSQGNIPIS